jgi:hypothetical protein
MTALYSRRLREGLEYQDFAVERLYMAGIPLVCYSSQKYQNEAGESMAGIEIKFDKEMSKSGNVYFETAEKSDPANSAYVPSGIYRSDNTWIYAIGDYSVLYLCAKNYLRRIFECERKPEGYRLVENGSGTSRGMLLPAGFVEMAAAKVLRFSSGRYEGGN